MGFKCQHSIYFSLTVEFDTGNQMMSSQLTPMPFICYTEFEIYVLTQAKVIHEDQSYVSKTINKEERIDVHCQFQNKAT